MLSTRTKQLLIIGLAIGLVAFLFFSGKNNSSALVKNQQHENAKPLAFDQKGFDFTKLEKDVQAKLKTEDAAALEALKIKQEQAKALEQIAEKYESLNQPALAGYYYMKLAGKQPQNEAYWYKAGKHFFEAQGTVEDSLTYAYFVSLSIQAYDSTLKLNPKNYDAKAEQAVNYIEGKHEPMKGVGLLREIVQDEPDNRKALMYLGILSMQSGQWQKAVERFEKLTQMEPGNDANYPYYFRYLGQAYAGAGNKPQAKEAYKKYKAYTETLNDPRLRQEAEDLVNSVQ